MAFRRPRVNVKPNVQASRPVGSNVRSTETLVDSVSTQSAKEQNSTQQIDLSITSPTVKGIHCSTRDLT